MRLRRGSVPSLPLPSSYALTYLILKVKPCYPMYVLDVLTLYIEHKHLAVTFVININIKKILSLKSVLYVYRPISSKNKY